MSKTTMIHARTDPKTKSKAETIFKKVGLTASDAINLFYKQVALTKGIPFEIKIPNKTLRKTFEDTDKGKNIIHCKNADDMFKKLGI